MPAGGMVLRKAHFFLPRAAFPLSLPAMDITDTPLPYVRIHSSLYHTLLSETSNTERGILLALICYCAINRNGGRIPNCRKWSRKIWQRAAGIASSDWTNRVRGRGAGGTQLERGWNMDGTRMEHACPFLAWDGDDLLVLAYPAEDERKASNHAGSRAPSAPCAFTGARACAHKENRREIKEYNIKKQYVPMF